MDILIQVVSFPDPTLFLQGQVIIIVAVHGDAFFHHEQSAHGQVGGIQVEKLMEE